MKIYAPSELLELEKDSPEKTPYNETDIKIYSLNEAKCWHCDKGVYNMSGSNSSIGNSHTLLCLSVI